MDGASQTVFFTEKEAVSMGSLFILEVPANQAPMSGLDKESQEKKRKNSMDCGQSLK